MGETATTGYCCSTEGLRALGVCYLKLPFNLKMAQQHLLLCDFPPCLDGKGLTLVGPLCTVIGSVLGEGPSTWSCCECSHIPYWQMTNLRGEGWRKLREKILRAKPTRSDSTLETAIRPGALHPQEWPWGHWQLVCGEQCQ